MLGQVRNSRMIMACVHFSSFHTLYKVFHILSYNRISFISPGGVAFGLMDLASKLHDSTADRAALLEHASQLVSANLKYLDHPDFKRDKKMQVGFLLGTPGVQVWSVI